MSAVVSQFINQLNLIYSILKNLSYVLVTVAGVFWAAGAVGDGKQEVLGAFQGAVNSSDGGQLILVLYRCLLKTCHTNNTEMYTLIAKEQIEQSARY